MIGEVRITLHVNLVFKSITCLECIELVRHYVRPTGWHTAAFATGIGQVATALQRVPNFATRMSRGIYVRESELSGHKWES